MKFPPMLAAGAILLAPLAAHAADPQAMAAPAAKPGPDPNRQICKGEDVPGSLIQKKKVCMSAAEWKERANRDGQWTEHMSTYNSQPNGR
jgi:hypothetical protein